MAYQGNQFRDRGAVIANTRYSLFEVATFLGMRVLVVVPNTLSTSDATPVLPVGTYQILEYSGGGGGTSDVAVSSVSGSVQISSGVSGVSTYVAELNGTSKKLLDAQIPDYLILPDRDSDSTETVPAGFMTNCAISTPGAVKTAPAPDAVVASPPKRFGIRARTAGDVTLNYKNREGADTTITVYATTTITFKQTSNLGFSAESGNASVSSMGRFFADLAAFQTAQAQLATHTTQIADLVAGGAGSSTLTSVDLFNGNLAVSAVAGPYRLDVQPPVPAVSFSQATITSTSDRVHTVLTEHSADGTTWTTLDSTAAVLSGSLYTVGKTLTLSLRYLRITITNTSGSISTNTYTKVGLA